MILQSKKQRNETFRGQAMAKYYKEDLLNILKECYSIEQLQEVMHIDASDKDNLIDVLRLGLKKEDLNVILFNSQNITEEALENYRKPNQRRNSVIIYREVPLGRNSSQDDLSNYSEIQEQNQVENIIENETLDDPPKIQYENILLTRDDSKLILLTREELKTILAPREEFIDNSFNEEGILAPREEVTDDFCDVGENVAIQDDLKIILAPRDDSKLILAPREEFIDNSFNAEGIFATREENSEIIVAREKEKDIIDIQEETIVNQSVDENTRETFLLSLNRIRNISQTKEKFQERLKGLVRNSVDFYEKTKSTYRQTDKNYQFYKDHIVPMAKYHNIPLEPYLARDQSEPLYFDRKSRLLRRKIQN